MSQQNKISPHKDDKKEQTTPAIDEKKGPEKILTSETTASYEGPIPLPSILKGYNEIDPSFANRVFVMAEKQNDANIEMAKKEQAGDMSLKKHGQLFAFGIVIIGYTFAFFSAFILRNTTMAVTSMITGTVPLAIVAVNGMLRK